MRKHARDGQTLAIVSDLVSLDGQNSVSLPHGFQPALTHPPAIFDIFLKFGLSLPSTIDGKVEPTMSTRPAQPKTNFLFLTRIAASTAPQRRTRIQKELTMGWKRAPRGAPAVAAALIAIGLSPAWRGRAPCGVARAAESTGWRQGPHTHFDRVGLRRWPDPVVRHDSGSPRRSGHDHSQVRRHRYGRGILHGRGRYRINNISEDKDGGSVDLEKIDSICTDLGIRGGGHEAMSREYTPKYQRVGNEWEKNHGSWVYELKAAPDQWRGPDLSFHSSSEFEVFCAQRARDLLSASRIRGVGIEESSEHPPARVHERLRCRRCPCDRRRHGGRFVQGQGVSEQAALPRGLVQAFQRHRSCELLRDQAVPDRTG